MDRYDKFQFAILKVAEKHLGKSFNEHRQELAEVSWNYLFNLDGPHSIERSLTHKEKFFAEIFLGFLEINYSINNLNDIELYIGRFQYTNTSITKPRYLRYHIENYLQEVYILKERLLAYLTKIGRLYKKDSRHKVILKSTKPIFKVVSEAFQNITLARGSHTHQTRFNDNDLDRLETFDLLTISGNDKLGDYLLLYYKLEYKKIRKKWKKLINNNNQAT